ncbi:hypothetical protein GCM10009737_30550 [Nocardioides lentus]|uniref:MFS transporter n=1 Tax=Nocardioides lentus TaxID=338077 RepID=A0ABN2PPS2_9ACTN
MRQSYLPLAGALVGAPVVIAVALSFVLLPREGATWGPWPLVVAALAVGGVVLAELLGYRTPPLTPGTDAGTARTVSAQRWQTAAMLRFVLTEAPLLLTIALAFVVETPEPFWLVAGAAAVAVAGLLLHVWPWSRPVNRFAEALERDGARTTLREDLGVLTAR